MTNDRVEHGVIVNSRNIQRSCLIPENDMFRDFLNVPAEMSELILFKRYSICKDIRMLE